jgi:hypothetical protein
MSANLLTAERIEQFKADLAIGMTSRELCGKYDIDENTLSWWVQTAKFMYPIDMRPRTKDMLIEAIAEMKAWYIDNQATMSELAARYGLHPYANVVRVLEELCITRNKRRSNAVTTGGRKITANKAGYESTRDLARSTSFASSVKQKDAHQQSDGLSIADRNRSLGLTKLDPDR